MLMSLGGASTSSPQAKKIEIGPLKPLKAVVPEYPESLKDDGIAGVVVIWAGIDREGNVRHPAVFRHLHPVLDKLALDAVSKWKFEPFFFGGESISFLTYISVLFEPGEPSAEKEPYPESPLSDELRSILGRCAEYCLKLEEVARFFICREKIDGSAKNIVERTNGLVSTGLSNGTSSSTVYQYPALEGSVRYSSINDYQLINKDGRFSERRIPIAARSQAGGGPEVGAFLSPFAPMSVPARLLARGHQDEFFYSLVEDEKIRGQKCIVIAIKPKRKRSSDFLSGKIWLDKTDDHIVKAEVEYGASIASDRILSECRRYHLTPHMIAVYDFEVEKKGLFYPSRTEIRLDYTGLVRPPKDTKAKLDISYDKYRFFSVETEPKIIK